MTVTRERRPSGEIVYGLRFPYHADTVRVLKLGLGEVREKHGAFAGWWDSLGRYWWCRREHWELLRGYLLRHGVPLFEESGLYCAAEVVARQRAEEGDLMRRARYAMARSYEAHRSYRSPMDRARDALMIGTFC